MKPMDTCAACGRKFDVGQAEFLQKCLDQALDLAQIQLVNGKPAYYGEGNWPQDTDNAPELRQYLMDNPYRRRR